MPRENAKFWCREIVRDFEVSALILPECFPICHCDEDEGIKNVEDGIAEIGTGFGAGRDDVARGHGRQGEGHRSHP